MKQILLAALLALTPVASTVMPAAAVAGSSEAGSPVLPADQVAAFADRVQRDLAARGANVAIVARMGRDPRTLPAGIRYTHVAYWVYSEIRNADGTTGRGYRAYNLYQRAGNDTRSDLVQDSPADFFAGAQQFDAGIIIPDARLQAKILKVIASPTYKALHNPNYSVLANPRTGQFQNCTEHTLDVMMAAIYGTSDKAKIRANITAYFKPQVIGVGGFKRAFATVASKALTTEDHGAVVATATFESIARFMQENGLAARVYKVTPKGASKL
jgi:hypothetical protein